MATLDSVVRQYIRPEIDQCVPFFMWGLVLVNHKTIMQLSWQLYFKNVIREVNYTNKSLGCAVIYFLCNILYSRY